MNLLDKETKKAYFLDFITDCRNKGQICGAGNPFSHILLVGKEHHAPTGKECLAPEIQQNDDVNAWLNRLKDNYKYCEEAITRTNWVVNNKSQTWTSYQQLVNKAIGREQNQSNIRDFEEFAFTTELNSEAKPTSNMVDTKEIPKKEQKLLLENRLSERLNLFKNSDFIQSFPVIVLACGSYIKNKGTCRQIDNTFGVEYDGKIKSPNDYWFCTHHNTANTRFFKAGEQLIIHTRQLSRFYKKEDFIDKIAETIHNHLHKLGLI